MTTTVTVNLGNAEQLARLERLMSDELGWGADHNGARLRGLTAALEGLLVDEPIGLGAVVVDADGKYWVRAGMDLDDTEPWRNEDLGWGPWVNIATARVLHEGWAAE